MKKIAVHAAQELDKFQFLKQVPMAERVELVRWCLHGRKHEKWRSSYGIAVTQDAMDSFQGLIRIVVKTVVETGEVRSEARHDVAVYTISGDPLLPPAT